MLSVLFAQLAAVTQEERGGGFTGPAHSSCQSTDHNGIHISNWTHKFQNKTGLDAKANSELYKSKQVCSAHASSTFYNLMNQIIFYGHHRQGQAITILPPR